MNQMATINNLPQELLLLILDCVRGLQESVHDTAGHKVMIHTLASVSRVSQRWRHPAQAIIWVYIMVWEKSHVDVLLASPAIGRHKTQELVVLERAAVGTGAAVYPGHLSNLVNALRGIESLIVDCGGEDGENGFGQEDWLSSPNLQGLEHLKLVTRFRPDPPLPLRPRFRLTSLELGFDTDSARVVSSILNASASTLDTLSINVVNDNILPSIRHFFAHSAGNLQYLTFDAREVDLVLPHASTLSSLKYISIFVSSEDEIEEVHALLRGLPSPIEELDMLIDDDGPGPRDQQAQAGILLGKLGTPAWVGLSRLCFMRAKREDLVALPQGELLVKRCEEEGVGVMFM